MWLTGNAARALVQQWEALRRTLVGPATTEKAKALLNETISALAQDNSRQPFLRNRRVSHNVWSALERHRVDWEYGLRLLPYQLAAVDPQQRQRIQEVCTRDPARVYTAVLSQGRGGGDEGSLCSAVRKSTTLVECVKVLRAALQARPELGGVLPVPHDVLDHLYQLALQPSPRQAENALLALQESRHLALEHANKTTAAKRERLEVRLALLCGRAGRWEESVALLKAAPGVRQATRDAFASFVKDRAVAEAVLQLPADKLAAADRGLVREALRRGADWTTAMAALARVSAAAVTDTWQYTTAFLSRADLPVKDHFETFLSLYTALPERQQTHALLNALAARMDPAGPRTALSLSAAMASPARRMQPAAFTRRLHQLTRAGEWTRALALACGALAFDLAAPIAPLLPSSCLRPSELYAYEAARNAVNDPGNSGPLPQPSEGRSAVPTLLAYAIYASPAAVQACVAMAPEAAAAACSASPRLRALLEALSPDDASPADGECFTYATYAATQLVARRATPQRHASFLAAIPPALRAFHAAQSLPDAIRAPTAVNGPSRRSTGTTEASLLRWFASASASGAQPQLDVTCLAAAAGQRYITLDATLVTRACAGLASSGALVASGAASAALLGALGLVGSWTEALQLYRSAPPSDARWGGGRAARTSRRRWAEAAVRVGAVAPRAVALRHLTAVWETYRCRDALALRDAIRGDRRELLSQLRALRDACGRATRRRRMLLGLAFSVLDSLEDLEEVTQAAGVAQVGPLDLDELGLQRVIRVVAPTAAVEAVETWAAAGETVQDHWLWELLPLRGLKPEARGRLAALRLPSRATRHVMGCLRGLEAGDGAMALRHVADFAAVSSDCGHDRWLVSLVRLLREFCESSNASVTEDERRAQEAALAAQELFWCLARHPRLARRVTHQRRTLRPFLEAPHRLSIPSLRQCPLCIAAVLLHEVSGAVRHPLSAPVTRRAMSLAARRPGPGSRLVALYLFRSLRDPRDEERAQVLKMVRSEHGAASMLLHLPRFFKHRPAFVVLLLDPSLRRVALQQLQNALTSAEDPCTGSTAALGDVVSTWPPERCRAAIRCLEIAQCGTEELQTTELISQLQSRLEACGGDAEPSLRHQLNPPPDYPAASDDLGNPPRALVGKRVSRPPGTAAEGMLFLGAGQRNAVLQLPPDFLDPAAAVAEGSRPLVGRLSRDEDMGECGTCLAALGRFTGPHTTITLSPQQRRAVSRCLAGVADSLLPFRSQLLARLDAADAGVVRMLILPSFNADFLVELKPKCAWRRPLVVGVEISGARTWLHPVKMHCCRFSQMQCRKQREAERRSAFCPNLLFRPDHPSVEGLRRLGAVPENNLRSADVAAALDSSGLLPLLERLQLHGVANPEPGPHGTSVLDVELLHPWFEAGEGADIFWIVPTDADGDAPCECGAVPASLTQSNWSSRDVCVRRRFYAATTARDVSIMVRVGDVSHPVGVVDVDDKHARSLAYYAAHDRRCVEAWMNSHTARDAVPWSAAYWDGALAIKENDVECTRWVLMYFGAKNTPCRIGSSYIYIYTYIYIHSRIAFSMSDAYIDRLYTRPIAEHKHIMEELESRYYSVQKPQTISDADLKNSVIRLVDHEIQLRQEHRQQFDDAAYGNMERSRRGKKISSADEDAMVERLYTETLERAKANREENNKRFLFDQNLAYPKGKKVINKSEMEESAQRLSAPKKKEYTIAEINAIYGLEA
eukprot:gene4384-3188_t